MADSFLTAAEMLVINDANLSGAEASDLRNAAPVVMSLAGEIASQGLTHKYLKRTGAASVGFRAESTGRENTKGTDTLVTVPLKLLDCSFAVDTSLADNYARGAQAYLAREARYSLAQGLFQLEKQIWYGTGTGGDSAGFSGLSQDANLNALADDMVIGAGGTTANTGSSVWAMRTNDMGADCQLVIGNQGQLSVGATVRQAIQDAANGGRFEGYFTPIQGHFTIQVGSKYSVGRIANLTEDSGKGLTDTLIAKLLAAFPANRRPNLMACSMRSLEQLRASRTATNATGAPAPFPTEAFGVRLIPTDSILDTEAIIT